MVSEMVKKKTLAHLSMIIIISLLLGSTQFQFGSSAAGTLSLQDQNLSTNSDYSSEIENLILSGEVSTADLIISDHPRIWLRPNWADKKTEGTFHWRVDHPYTIPPGTPWYGEPLFKDTSEGEFNYVSEKSRYGDTGGEEPWHEVRGGSWVTLAGIGKREGIKSNVVYNADDYFNNARDLLFEAMGKSITSGEWMWQATLAEILEYDWLYNATYSDGRPVLSEDEKKQVITNLIDRAENSKSRAQSQDDTLRGGLFCSNAISNYLYTVVGMVLYEPSRMGDSTYVDNKGRDVNAYAKSYLDDFDEIVVGKIIPAMNMQGADGGWHGGMWYGGGWIEGIQLWDSKDDYQTMPPAILSVFLFAHMTATGQRVEDSLYTSDFLKNFAVFQAYMVSSSPTHGDELTTYNNYAYLGMGKGVESSRYIWIHPLMTYSRLRFSTRQEDRDNAELGRWISHWRAGSHTNAGSNCFFEQLMFEDKWYNPRSPEEIGFPLTKHFRDLGWVIMKESFTEEESVTASFICQKYHWSVLDHYAQNSFTIERNGRLAVDAGYHEGGREDVHSDNYARKAIAHNTVLVYDPAEQFAWGGNDGGQRVIDSNDFPSVLEGPDAYAPGSVFDVGPGILEFESNDVYDYILGDASNAYGSKVSKFTRQFIYLKPDIFVIFDIVTSIDPSFEKRWLLHPYNNGEAPKVIDSKTGATASGNSPRAGLTVYDTAEVDMFIVRSTNEGGDGKLWVKVLLPETSWIRRIGGSSHEFESFQALNDSSNPATNYEVNNYKNVMGWGRFEVAPKDQNLTDYFLHVLQVGSTDLSKDSPNITVDDATVMQEGDWFHVQVAGRKISFSKSGEFEFDGQPTTLRGDLNLDGIVDHLDVQLSVNVLLAFERDPAILGRADLNKDGIVNSLDIQEIFLEANK
jgi:hypothetical protein